VDNTARTEILRVIRIFRLLLGIEVIKVAEEFVEAVIGGQEIVAVAKMVFAKLTGGISQRLRNLGDRSIDLSRSIRDRLRQTHPRQPGTKGTLAGDKSGAAGGAALLAVIVGRQRAFLGKPIDVRRALAHDARVIRADIRPADSVGHDDENIRSLAGTASRIDRSHSAPGLWPRRPRFRRLARQWPIAWCRAVASRGDRRL
jgi:hypothetical protein